MLDDFKNHLTNRLPFLLKGKLLIAISGGVDSVVLTYLCKQMGLKFALAHCNFNLRGKESDADEAFVLLLAEDLDVEVFIESFETETYSKSNKCSTQVAARELRYGWFQELAECLNFDYVLTAHHADDNLETFLINLTRGTGLDGLMGIPEVNNKTVRPLLPFSREDIEVYAINLQIQWREDSSNSGNKYLRNRLRHDIVPTLKQMNPQLLQNFKSTISNLEDSKEIIEDAIARFQRKVVSIKDDVIRLEIRQIRKYSNPKAYLYELLKDFNFTEWQDVVGLLNAHSGKKVFSNSHRLLKNREFLLLTPLQNEKVEEEKIIISENEKQIDIPLGTLTIESVESMDDFNKNRIYVDERSLKFPLEVRKWKEGDLFYPLGMEGKKKISKYLKDEKLSLIEKEQVWLLCSEEHIVWVVGMRADERFKVKEHTEHMLKIELLNT